MSEQANGRFSFVIGFICGAAAAYTANFVYSSDKGEKLRAEFAEYWAEAKKACSKAEKKINDKAARVAKKIPKKRGPKPGSKKKKKKVKKFKGV